MPPRRAALAALLALALLAPLRAGAEVVVFAAASLKTALDAVAGRWEAAGGAGLRIAYAGSSALARQIAAGAPAELFVSANADWMDRLEAGGRVEPGSRRDLLGNRLVLVAHGAAGGAAEEIGPGFDLAARLGDGRLAMAFVEAVPAGIYGKAALTALGLWEAVAPRVAQADNVRAALALVARGEAPLGVVYATDAAAEPGVSVIGIFPEGSHPPIRYPAALVRGAGPEAARLLDHLASAGAMEIFRAHGFLPPPAPE